MKSTRTFKLKILLGIWYTLRFSSLVLTQYSVDQATPMIWCNFVFQILWMLGMGWVILYERRPIEDASCTKLRGGILLFAVMTMYELLMHIPLGFNGVLLWFARSERSILLTVLVIAAVMLFFVKLIVGIITMVNLLGRKQRARYWVKVFLWIALAFNMAMTAYTDYTLFLHAPIGGLMDQGAVIIEGLLWIFIVTEYMRVSQRVQRTLVR